jgi:hypothetical protein
MTNIIPFMRDCDSHGSAVFLLVDFTSYLIRENMKGYFIFINKKGDVCFIKK